ncbi:MAG: SEL1-like repeat protein [Magnetococcales bacterium]|nr:SEL1-like repeat protein [Magnetococcales bacterium]
MRIVPLLLLLVGLVCFGGVGMAADLAAVTAKAEAGERESQWILGLRYLEGRGVEQDKAKAEFWLRKAAEQGSPRAQYRLGRMYDKGDGVVQDSQGAAAWYLKAAEQGMAAAQNNLGNLFRDGRGVEQDHAEAVDWYRKAVAQDSVTAQANLGLMYEGGFGVAQDRKQALFWLRKAAARGNLKAQAKLREIAGGGAKGSGAAATAVKAAAETDKKVAEEDKPVAEEDKEAAAATKETSTAEKEPPAATKETSTAEKEPPAAAKDAPAAAKDAPATTRQAPVVTRKAPAVVLPREARAKRRVQKARPVRQRSKAVVQRPRRPVESRSYGSARTQSSVSRQSTVSSRAGHRPGSDSRRSASVPIDMNPSATVPVVKAAPVVQDLPDFQSGSYSVMPTVSAPKEPAAATTFHFQRIDMGDEPGVVRGGVREQELPPPSYAAPRREVVAPRREEVVALPAPPKPLPRFVDNGNGTVSDNKKGLVGLKNANCFGKMKWLEARDVVYALANGSCQLTDGSHAGEWRLPTMREMQILLDWQESGLFEEVQSSSYYWSSTLHEANPNHVWYLLPDRGMLYNGSQERKNLVWPVRKIRTQGTGSVVP